MTAGLPTTFAERVLDVVAAIPPGRVLSYGDVAELLGGRGARAVGQVMARFGGGVPWWRVVHADGRLPGHKDQQALGHHQAEGTPLRDGRVDMARARWDAAPLLEADPASPADDTGGPAVSAG